MKHTAGLLTPGPVAVDPRVLSSLSQYPLLHHRSPEFSEMLQCIERTIRSLFQVPQGYDIAFVGTSGTGLTEAMIRLLASLPKGKILFLSNGHFGDRLHNIGHNLNLEHEAHEQSPLEPYNLDAIENILKNDSSIGSLVMVHHETSLGQFNHIPQIQALCEKYGVFLGMDMVSSLGGERFTFADIQPDIGVSVSGKALAAFPGIAIAFVKQTLSDNTKGTRNGQHFLDLRKYLAFWQENYLLPFTPPIQLFPALQQALLNIAEEGLENKWNRHAAALGVFDRYLGELGFSHYPVVNPSNTTRTYQYPEEQTREFDIFVRKMDEIGYMVYQNVHYHKPERLFQVSTMGNVPPSQLEEVVAQLRKMC